MMASREAQTRFLIVGLPRSGTTYLMTLLNSHPDVLCAGEQFNPYAVIDSQSESRDSLDLLQRDWAPRAHSKAFFKSHAAGGHTCVGYKFMIGQNVRMLSGLPELADLRLIYVHRENRLAQISSLIKADTTKRWAQVKADLHVARKIDVGPYKISQFWHEFATYDFLFSEWFRILPQRKMKLEYREMFREGFERRLCRFLDIEFDPGMKSPLVKQGTNTILNRFEHPEPIRKYFTKLGRQRWLESEI